MRTTTTNNTCPTCSVTLDDQKGMTITIDPPNEPMITHDCGYSATMKAHNAAKAQMAIDACMTKYPDMYNS